MALALSFGDCRPNASRICCATVITGFSEYFGSCRIMLICVPQRRRRSFGRRASKSWLSSRMASADQCADAGSSPSNARPVSDFPDSDSPTIPNRSPLASVREMPRTASVSVPSWPSNAMRKLSISQRVSACMSASLTGIEDIAQTIAEQVERKTHEQDRDAGNGRDPPRVEQHAPSRRHHETPLRTRRLRIEPEKTESRDRQDDAGHVERRAYDYRRRTQRDDIAQQNAHGRRPLQARHVDERSEEH